MLHIGIDGHNLETERTGVGRYLENLLCEFTHMPHLHNKVRFTVYFKKEIPRDTFLQNSLFTVRLLKTPVRPSFLLYFLVLLPVRAWRDKVDILWFPGYMTPFTWRGRSVIVLHDVIFTRYPESVPLRYRLPYRIFSRYGAGHSEKILTVSEFSKQEIIALYGVTHEKVMVTPLGVDPQFRVFDDPQSLRRIKDKYGIRKDYILYLGQIFTRRHVPEAMKAYARIAKEFPSVQFLVVGRNRTNPYIDITVLAGDINDVLGYEGVIREEFVPDKDLVPLYAGALAGFYLSDYEGFGLPPLEMLACGTPVLAPNTTSLATTLQGKQVIIENPKDVEEIAKKLQHVLENSAYRQRIRHEGPAFAAQFRWEQTAEQTLDMFFQLPKGKRS